MTEEQRLAAISALIHDERRAASQRVAKALEERLKSHAYDGDALDFDELAEIAVRAVERGEPRR